MQKPRAQVTTVMFNSEKPEQLVRFWSSILEVSAHPHTAETEHIWLMPQEPNGFKLGFQRVAKKLNTNAEVHLDIAVHDLDEIEKQVLELGGKVIQRTKLDNGFEWRVLHDPQDNPFCIYQHFTD